MEEYSGNKCESDQSIDVDVIETSNDDETLFVDEQKKGARTLENNLVYPGSNTLLGNEIYKNEIGNSGIDKVAVEEKANISKDSQRSEIMRGKEVHGETFAQHTSHRVINTKTILMKSKYIMAEIVETNERTLTGEVHTHWDMIEVWDTQTQPDDVDLNDQIEIGTDVAWGTQSNLEIDTNTDTQTETESNGVWDNQKDSDVI